MTNYMDQERRFIVTILAGGEGKRMRSEVPKVLCPFLGEPMIIRILRTVFSLQPDKIFIVVGKYKEQIQSTIESIISDQYIIEYIDQPTPLGTGHAINCCLPYYLETDRILILNGDMPCITSTFLQSFLIESSLKTCTIVTAKVDNPFGYGRIECDSNGDFVRIIEENDCNPQEKKINQINAGIYLVNGYILFESIPAITDKRNVKKEYYLTDLFAYHKNNSTIPIHIFETLKEENWMIQGVNTPEELEEAESKTNIILNHMPTLIRYIK
jgi:bifunctional UDP-N-acetylglucosamine pyrophosphorylase / glucosamine-1-phosphate N-acetyltransferase